MTASPRIIPARAGFTRSASSRACRPRDHPRSRGVYAFHRVPDPPGPGSSPLARGLLSLVPRGSRSRRIIPARAGFTKYPPLKCFFNRIIPARAGFTSGRSVQYIQLWDHPRSRGVYGLRGGVTPSASGSSPLARGLPPMLFLYSFSRPDHPRSRGVYEPCPVLIPVNSGIIPARAGFTHVRYRDGGITQDHPRSRGVYVHTPPDGIAGSGSSPLARGLRDRGGRRRGGGRIIPARAGFTEPPPRREKSEKDHPRSRGVYSIAMDGGQAWKGSSPLARGLRRCGGCLCGSTRIIPARAGFTED